MDISTTNPNKRTTSGSVDTLFLLDRQQTSYLNIYKIAQEFVLSKDPESSWKDFWAGSVGTTIMQLMAGHSEYNAYNAITARREAFLFEAKQRSSALSVASTLGYPVFRGQNLHLLITFVPDATRTVKKFDIVGSMSTLDLVSLEDKVFTYGQKAELLVSVGKLMEESISIPSAKTHWFRFYSDKVSEDILLQLNGSEVPYSRSILDVLKDSFAVLSNSVGGIDVLYTNRYPPAAWSPMSRYTFYDYIKPNYTWRVNHQYNVGDVVTSLSDSSNLPVFYTCTKAGISGSIEPTWPTVQGQSVDAGNNTWKNTGKKETPRYFKSLTQGMAVSGNSEPNWPNVIGATITEGKITWGCVDTYTESKYNYDTGDILKLLYVETEEITFDSDKLAFDCGVASAITIQSKYQEPESISRIQETAPLYHETQHVIRGREDYRKLLRSVISNISDTNSYDISPAVVAVTYVKDHTQKTWAPSIMVSEGDEILPSYQNGFIYKATRGGYVASNQSGKTLDVEPIWSKSLNTLTEDGQVIWRTLALNPVAGAVKWRSKFVYNVGDYCLPSDSESFPGIMFRVDRVDSEPDWPALIGSTVVDNEVEWVCAETIYLEGYTASYYQTNTAYNAGDLVQPVLETGYFYKARNAGTSGAVEPDWPTTICSTCLDGEIEWECYDTLTSEVYQKNTAQRTLEAYRPFGVQPPVIQDPVLVHVGLGIYLDLLRKVDESQVRADVQAILNRYQKVLALDLRIIDFENVLEQNLDYVRVARVYCLENSKTKNWQPGMLCKDGDVVIPSNRAPAPGFSGLPSARATDYTKGWAGLDEAGYTDLLYRAKVVAGTLQGKTSGYTAFPDRGVSGNVEPSWPTVEGETVTEGSITWTMVSRSSVSSTPASWLPGTTYFLGSMATPVNILFSSLVAKVTDIAYNEPAWPQEANKMVRDNELYWLSFNPQERILPLAWNEYYIFRSEFKITLRGEEMV